MGHAMFVSSCTLVTLPLHHHIATVSFVQHAAQYQYSRAYHTNSTTRPPFIPPLSATISRYIITYTAFNLFKLECMHNYNLTNDCANHPAQKNDTPHNPHTCLKKKRLQHNVQPSYQKCQKGCVPSRQRQQTINRHVSGCIYPHLHKSHTK